MCHSMSEGTGEESGLLTGNLGVDGKDAVVACRLESGAYRDLVSSPPRR